MPAKDLFHDAVKTALQHAGWEITHDPYQLKYEDVKIAIDLGAEVRFPPFIGPLKVRL